MLYRHTPEHPTYVTHTVSLLDILCTTNTSESLLLQFGLIWTFLHLDQFRNLHTNTSAHWRRELRHNHNTKEAALSTLHKPRTHILGTVSVSVHGLMKVRESYGTQPTALVPYHATAKQIDPCGIKENCSKALSSKLQTKRLGEVKQSEGIPILL